MPIYTVQVTVEVAADTQNDAYKIIKKALDSAKLAEIVHIDSEVTASRPDEDDDVEPDDDAPDDEPPRKLTRQERLQGLADRGIDTWSEYKGER